MPSSLPSSTCELVHNCTVSSGNRGIPANVSGVDFKNAIRSHLNGTLIYGSKITCWDVSEVTNMDEAFTELSTFDDPLCWDVSSVTTMVRMFSSSTTLTAFNQDLSTWDVSSVTDMSRMFTRAHAFNQDLSAWDVSSVTTMRSMFLRAHAFNPDLSVWNVSSVTIMTTMFFEASAFNQDISAWDVSSVTNTFEMFRSASTFNQNLCTWASKSPKLLSSSTMFAFSSCNNSTNPVLKNGTVGDPHDGPFCFTC
eukprot:scaffold2367_cov59-Attheya_sp.AAC.2